MKSLLKLCKQKLSKCKCFAYTEEELKTQCLQRLDDKITECTNHLAEIDSQLLETLCAIGMQSGPAITDETFAQLKLLLGRKHNLQQRASNTRKIINSLVLQKQHVSDTIVNLHVVSALKSVDDTLRNHALDMDDLADTLDRLDEAAENTCEAHSMLGYDADRRLEESDPCINDTSKSRASVKFDLPTVHSRATEITVNKPQLDAPDESPIPWATF